MAATPGTTYPIQEETAEYQYQFWNVGFRYGIILVPDTGSDMNFNWMVNIYLALLVNDKKCHPKFGAEANELIENRYNRQAQKDAL